MTEQISSNESFGQSSDILSKVILIWEAATIEVAVASCCSHGVKILALPQVFTGTIPNKKDVVKIAIPNEDAFLTGMCTYVTEEPDGFIAIGIYFFHPDEQNLMHDLLTHSTDIPRFPASSVSHEWVELVDKLCKSNDESLRTIGLREHEILMEKNECAF